MSDSLEQAFLDVYTLFKLHFYRKIFSRFESREASLTAVETFCVEVINALGSPTINEFAKFIGISQANAAYKVQNLIEKGYVIKSRSTVDKREYHLIATDKFHEFMNLNIDYVGIVMSRIREQVDADDAAAFERVLKVIASDLMPEIPKTASID